MFVTCHTVRRQHSRDQNPQPHAPAGSLNLKITWRRDPEGPAGLPKTREWEIEAGPPALTSPGQAGGAGSLWPSASRSRRRQRAGISRSQPIIRRNSWGQGRAPMVREEHSVKEGKGLPMIGRVLCGGGLRGHVIEGEGSSAITREGSSVMEGAAFRGCQH